MNTITINLKPMSFIVDGDTEEEMLENAKKEMVKELGVEFPYFTYSVNSEDVLKEEDAYIGTIVKDEKGNIGIISDIKYKNKMPVVVTMKKGLTVVGTYNAFKLSDKSFEDARYIRSKGMKEVWNPGDTGYIRVDGIIREVIVGFKQKDQYLLYAINGKGIHYKVPDYRIDFVLKEEKPD